MIKLLLLLSAFTWMDIEYHEDKGIKKLFSVSNSLINEFSAANTLYFHGDTTGAKQKYLLLSLRLYDENWDFSQRKILGQSLLRLCQLDRLQCETHLKELVYFDPDLVKHIDSEIFEPPLVQQALLTKNQLERNFYLWQPTKEHELVKYFIVNGRIYTNVEGLQIPLPLTKQRIVLVYDSYKTEVFVGQTADYIKWIPKRNVAEPSRYHSDLNLSPSASATRSEDISTSQQWWQENKKTVLLWSLAAGVAAYYVHKNKKSSDTGGPSTTVSTKE